MTLSPQLSPVALEARLAENEALLTIGTELAESLELSQVLDTALRKAEHLCRAETSSIWELDQDSGELSFQVVRGRVARAIRDLRVPLGQGIVGSVAQSGRAEVINDVHRDSRWKGEPIPAGESFETRAILAVPLIAQGRVVGVLQLLNPVGREGFTQDDLRRMRLFGGLVAHAVENARLYTQQRRQFLQMVTALAEAIEKRDPYTGGHVRRVVLYSTLLGYEMDLGPEDLYRLRLAATLHDVGKIAVPDAILSKAAPLDEEERSVMARHPQDGAEIVGGIRGMRELLPGIRSHHERMDGEGYPDGLSGGAIPLDARIIAVADTFDAMTTTRPYRAALPRERAVAEILRCSGTQFCPQVVGAFERLTERGEMTLERGERLLASLSEEGQGE